MAQCYPVGLLPLNTGKIMSMQFFRHESYNSHDVIHQATSPECLHSSAGHVFLRFFISNQTFSTSLTASSKKNSIASSERAMERLVRFTLMADCCFAQFSFSHHQP